MEKWKYQSDEWLYTLERQKHYKNFKWHRDELGLKRKNTDTISPKHGHLVKKEIRIISLDILPGWTLDLGNCLIFGKLVANWPVNKKVYNFSWDWIWRFPLLGKSIHYLSSGLANIPLDFAKILHVTLRWHQRDCAVSPPPPTWSAMLPWSGVFASSSTFPVHLHAVLGFEDTKAQRTLSLLLELSQKSVGVRTAGKGTVAGEYGRCDSSQPSCNSFACHQRNMWSCLILMEDYAFSVD